MSDSEFIIYVGVVIGKIGNYQVARVDQLDDIFQYDLLAFNVVCPLNVESMINKDSLYQIRQDRP